MVVRVIDIETTGMDPATDAIIEIASVDLVKGGGITKQIHLRRAGAADPAAGFRRALHHR
jgi:DNA polymerase III epsilon subunit-like protein